MNCVLEPLQNLEIESTVLASRVSVWPATWSVLGLLILAGVAMWGLALLVSFLRSKAPRDRSRALTKSIVMLALAAASVLVVLVWPSRRQEQRRRRMQVDQGSLVVRSNAHGVRASGNDHNAFVKSASDPHPPVDEPETSAGTDAGGRSYAVAESTYKAVRSHDLFGTSESLPSGGDCEGDREVIYHLIDPLGEWRRQSSLPDDARPRIERASSSGETAVGSTGSGSPPGWVADAGGSRPFSLQLGCVSVIGRRPGPTGELVGYSAAWQPDLEQAEADADRSVVEQLSAVLLRNLAIRAAEAPDLSSQSLLIDDLLDLVEARARVASDDLLAGSFVEERTRNYGSPYKLYREAKLIRVSDGRLAELTDAVVEDVHHASARLADVRLHTLWTLAAAVGLALVAFLLYSFINAGTKGYFAWPLRIVSLAALVLLYVGLFYFHRWID